MKKFTVGLLLCGFALTATGLVVNAEGEIGPSHSKGKIQFVPGGTDGGEVTPPTNPDPDTEKDPDPDVKPEPEEPTEKGPLKILELPTLDFGKVQLATYKQNYYAKFDKRQYTKPDGTKGEGTYPSMVVLQDLRGGTKGWSVSVAHDGIFTKTKGGSKIKATLALKNGNVESGTFKEQADLDKYTPEALVTNAAYKEISSTDGKDNVMILKADVGKGYGKWSYGFGSKKVVTSGLGLDGNGTTGKLVEEKKGLNPAVRLTVPTQVIETDNDGVYETTLTWTLSTAV